MSRLPFYLMFFLCFFPSILTFGNLIELTSEEKNLVQFYRELKDELEYKNKIIEELNENKCIQSNDLKNECSKPWVVLEEYLQSRFELIGQLKDWEDEHPFILDYFDENGNLLDTVVAQIQLDGEIIESCYRPNLAEIIEQSDGMLKFINKLKKLKTYPRYMNIPNAKKRDCDEKIKNECWDIEGQNIFYITKTNLKIDSICLIQDGPEDKKRDPSYSPENIINQADIALEKFSSCFDKIDSYASSQVKQRIASQDYYLYCKPQTEDDEKCGNATKGSESFNLFFNPSCVDYAETIFHEILHMNGTVDNLHTHKHNDSFCHKHDAVYFCTRYCFPQSKRNYIKFTQKACEVCIQDPSIRKKECEKSIYNSTEFDQSHFSCFSGGGF